MLVAGSNWPVPDLAGRSRYADIAIGLLLIGNSFAFLVWYGTSLMPGKKVEQIVALHFFGQVVYLFLGLMIATEVVQKAGIEGNVILFTEMHADAIGQFTFSFGEPATIILVGCLALVRLFSSSGLKTIFSKRSNAGFPFNPRLLATCVARIVGSFIVIAFLDIISYSIPGVSPAIFVVYAACLPHVSWFVDRSFRIGWRLLPGLIAEASFVAVVAMDVLGFLYIIVGCASSIVMIVLQIRRDVTRRDEVAGPTPAQEK
jgi:hypothetical protein